MDWNSIQWDALNTLIDNTETPFISIIKWNSIRQAFKAQQIKLLNYLILHISEVFDFAIATQIYQDDHFCNLNCLYFLTSAAPAFTSQLTVNATFKQKLSSFIANLVPNQPIIVNKENSQSSTFETEKNVSTENDSQSDSTTCNSATTTFSSKSNYVLYNSQLTSFCRIFQFHIQNSNGLILSNFPQLDSLIPHLLNHINNFSVSEFLYFLTNTTSRSVVNFLENVHAPLIFLNSISSSSIENQTFKLILHCLHYLSNIFNKSSSTSSLLSDFPANYIDDIIKMALETVDDTHGISSAAFDVLLAISGFIDDEEDDSQEIYGLYRAILKQIPKLISFVTESELFLSPHGKAFQLLMKIILNKKKLPDFVELLCENLLQKCFKFPYHSNLHNAFLAIFQIFQDPLPFVEKNKIKQKIIETFKNSKLINLSNIISLRNQNNEQNEQNNEQNKQNNEQNDENNKQNDENNKQNDENNKQNDENNNENNEKNDGEIESPIQPGNKNIIEEKNPGFSQTQKESLVNYYSHFYRVALIIHKAESETNEKNPQLPEWNDFFTKIIEPMNDIITHEYGGFTQSESWDETFNFKTDSEEYSDSDSDSDQEEEEDYSDEDGDSSEDESGDEIEDENEDENEDDD